MNEKTCKTWIDNDNDLCDWLGKLMEDGDYCEKHRMEYWKDVVIRTFLAGH